MTERRINLDKHEALAAAEGRLRVILRPVLPQPDREINGEPYWSVGGYMARPWTHPTDDCQPRRPLSCPYGSPGDVLIGREKWGTVPDVDGVIYGTDTTWDHEPNAIQWRSASTMPAAIARHRWTVERIEAVKCSELHPRLLRDGTDDELARDWWTRRWPKCSWETSWAWKVEVSRG